MTIELTLSTSLLIAHPQIEGEFFARSVIYLVSHNEERSFGFIINQPSDFSLGDLMGQEVPKGELTSVQIGGPVGMDRLFSYTFLRRMTERLHPQAMPYHFAVFHRLCPQACRRLP